MQCEHSYLIPDYYEQFLCKGPDCRSTCCKNWRITLSLDEYLSLLGLDCTDDLRGRLDCAMRPAESPTPDRYAFLSPNWEGDCRLHRADGWCALQKECGEEVLSSVCRYYPRSPRAAYDYVCSCSCSCEKTIEMLFERGDRPITFSRSSMSFSLAMEEERIPTAEGYTPVMRVIEKLQDRAAPLTVRLASLQTMFGASDALWVSENGFGTAVRFLLLLLEQTARGSHNLHDFLPSVFAGFGWGETVRSDSVTEQDIQQVYAAVLQLPERLPDWEIRFEHMLVNHVFYSAFPYREGTASLMEDATPLYAAYALLRFLAAGYLAGGGKEAGLVDLFAVAFRLIDHTAFAHNVPVVLHASALASPARHTELLML